MPKAFTEAFVAVNFLSQKLPRKLPWDLFLKASVEETYYLLLIFFLYFHESFRETYVKTSSVKTSVKPSAKASVEANFLPRKLP